MCNELSILIPVYNYDIRQLVGTLHQQCSNLGIAFEILCADDGSQPAIISLNKDILTHSHTRYEILPRHLGRVAIRNKLAQDARFPFLLLLDNDSQIVHPQFIRRYLDAAGSVPVLVGGTCYQLAKPPAPYLLRWLYGRKREERSAARRNQTPYRAFYINNLFLTRDIWQRFPLQPLLRSYGHEDSLLGHQLEAAGIPVRHLDNPVLHAGLEPAAVFLEKSRQAIENLYWLYTREGAGGNSRLVRGYLFLRKWMLLSAFKLFYQAIKPVLLYNLQGPAPSLWLFDLFKLYHFSCQARKKVLRNT